MERTRREALDEFLLAMSVDGNTTQRNRAERMLNRAVETIWLKHTFRDYLSPAPLRITLVVGQSAYALPDWWGRLGEGEVRNISQNGHVLRQMLPRELSVFHPTAGTSQESTGQPTSFMFLGITGVYEQPDPAGETLEVLSSDGSDTDVQVVIEGEKAGREQKAAFTLTGATPVAVGNWNYIDQFSKSYNVSPNPTGTTELSSSRGQVTLRRTADSSQLQVLLPTESAREHRIIRFYPIPNAADVITVPGIRRAKRLVYDADVLPADWWPALFEEMVIQHRVETGELASDAVVPRPRFAELVTHDNRGQPNLRRKKPFPRI